MPLSVRSEEPRVGHLLKEMATLLDSLEQICRPLPQRIDLRRAATYGSGSVCEPQTLCRDLYRIRRVRDEILGDDLCRERAWDMMLDLYQAELDGTDVTVVSLCAAALTPQTSGLRVISTLVARGLVQKRADTADRRRCFVTLTVRGNRAMAEFVNRIAAPRPPEHKAA